MKIMIKKTPLFFALFLLAASPSLCWAQAATPFSTASPEKNAGPTSPDYIAMVFNKLTGQTPDFTGWALKSKAYTEAGKFEKQNALKKQSDDYKRAFSLLTLQEPITVEAEVKLSAYSQVNQGYFIESFKEDTYFATPFAGEIYAIVPIRIMDHQWLKVDAATAKTIDISRRVSNDNVLLSISLLPTFADKSSPANLNGQKQWLLSAEIKDMAMYPLTGGPAFWRSKDEANRDAKHQELLNLYH